LVYSGNQSILTKWGSMDCARYYGSGSYSDHTNSFEAWYYHEFLIKLIAIQSHAESSLSYTYFLIDSNIPELTGSTGSIDVSTPSAGERYSQGDQISIQWSSANDLGSIVYIQMWCKNGVLQSDFGDVATQSYGGSLLWTVPLDFAVGNYSFHINVPDGRLSGDSGLFEITSKEIQVVSPNGGEQWIAGQSYSIQWTSKGVGDTVSIQVSTDAGILAFDLGSVPNVRENSLDWQIPSDFPEGNYTIHVQDSSGKVSDDSDSSFQIVSQHIEILSPLAGETYGAGAQLDIKWKAHGVNTVAIDFDKQPVGVVNIAENVPANDGELIWIIPTSQEPGNYKVSIYSGDPPPGAMCESGIFAIKSPISLTQPNDGQAMHCGDWLSVKWEIEPGFDKPVTVTLLVLDSGSGSQEIQMGVEPAASNGLDWRIPTSLDVKDGLTCMVRIEAGGYTDQSDLAFTIKNAIQIVAPTGISVDWFATTTHPIIWWSPSIVADTVKITLYKSQGSPGVYQPYLVQEQNYPNTGSYDLYVSPDLDSAVSYYVEIYADVGARANSPIIWIESPIKLLYPAGEGYSPPVLKIGVPDAQVVWSKADPMVNLMGTVKISLQRYWRGDFAGTTVLADSWDINTMVFHWRVPLDCDVGFGAGYKIEVYQNPAVKCVSSTWFSISDLPARPRSLAATTTGDSITLMWKDPGYPGDEQVVGYAVYRDGVFMEGRSTDNAFFLDNTVIAGKTYYYEVKAMNTLGWGLASAITATAGAAMKVSSSEQSTSLGVGETRPLTVNGESHSVTLDSMTENGASVTVSSEPQHLNLTLGESQNVDIDNNGIYDIAIRLVSISGENATLAMVAFQANSGASDTVMIELAVVAGGAVVLIAGASFVLMGRRRRQQ
jgi:hypothetical protein